MQARRRARWLAIPLLLMACGGREPEDPPVLLIGVDGLEWSVLLPMVQRGELPALRDLMERGVYGKLETLTPTLSPAIWTSVVTGKRPAKHGIRNFTRREGDHGQRLNTSLDRRVKALWNVFSDAGLGVHSVGWWMTFPVESISGTMIAQTNTPAQINPKRGGIMWKGSVVRGLPGQVHPVALQESVMDLAGTVERELPERVDEAFDAFAHPLSKLGDRLWNDTLWSFRADNIYRQWTVEWLSGGEPFDLLLVYFGGTDVVAHRFWRFMAPEGFEHAPSREEVEDFGDLIAAYYRWIDAAIAEIQAAAPRDASVILLSDHGMHAINLDASFDPDAPGKDVNSSGHGRAPPGVLIAAGARIRRQADAGPDLESVTLAALPVVGSVLDITPTVLTLKRLPVAGDMDGRALTDLLDVDFLVVNPPAEIASYDTPDWRAAREGPGHSAESEAQRMEQLRALGYID